MNIDYDSDFEIVMKELKDRFGWSNIDTLPDSYKDLLNDTIKALKQVKNNGVLDDVIKRFEIGARVSWCKHPSPCFYVMEQKGKDVLICNTTNVEDDNYNDWWVDYKEINVL